MKMSASRFFEAARHFNISFQCSCFYKKDKEKRCKSRSICQLAGQWKLRTQWPEFCSSGARTLFLSIYSVKRKDLISNLVPKLKQEACKCYQMSSTDKGPTYLQSYMGPSFVAGLRGVPSEAE